MLAEMLGRSAFLGWAAEHFEADSRNLAGMFFHNSVKVIEVRPLVGICPLSPTFIRRLAAVIENLDVNDSSVDGRGSGHGPPPVVPLPQLLRPRRRRRLITARVRRPSGRVQV